MIFEFKVLPFLLCSLLLSARVVFSADFPEPVKEWSLELGNEYAGSPTPYPRVNPNSVIVATGGHLIRIDGAGKIISRFEYGPANGRGGEIMPPLVELDGDDNEEIILTNKTGIIYGYDVIEEKILWETDLGQPIDQYSFVTAGDLDNDNFSEVIVTSREGWATCLDEDGSIIWRTRVYTVDRSIVPEISKADIGDINNDGYPEVVYGTATHHLIALDRNGKLIWDSIVPPHQMSRTPVLISDVDQNGKAEIYSMSSMLSPNKGLVCVDGETGKHLWTGQTIGKAYLGLKPIRFSDGTMGILACDKGGNIHAHRADGSLAWHTRLNGRGVYWPPSIADLDGDGRLEIVATIRWTSQDDKGYNWYVLDADTGKLHGGYPNGDGYPSASVFDIDGDKVLEVLINSTSGQLSCFSFGGSATKEAIFIGSWYEPGYPERITPHSSEELDKVPQISMFLDENLLLRFGYNAINISHPVVDTGRQSLQLTCMQPDGIRRVTVRSIKPGTTSTEFSLPVVQSGKYSLEISLLDLDSGKTMGQDALTLQVRSVTRKIQQMRTETVASLNSARNYFVKQGLNRASFLAKLVANIEVHYELLESKIKASAAISSAELEVLLREADDYMTLLERSTRLMQLALANADNEVNSSFIVWQDNEPWDNKDPLDELPADSGESETKMWAFGDEIESISFNIVNISPDPIQIRVEPGSIRSLNENFKQSLPKITQVVDFHTAVSLPSHGKLIPDLLPKLGEGQLVDIAPGQVKSIWLNISTHDLIAGSYELTWKMRTLDSASNSSNLKITLDVSTARCPEKSRFLSGYWRPTNLYGHNLIEDMNKHLVTMWYGLPLPSAKANEHGEILEEMDWSQHDEIVHQIKQPELLFYAQSQVPTPSFPEGIDVTDELTLAGQKSYAKKMVAHLAELGLGYENFMFYVEDEPGLKGEIAGFMRNARRNKLIDPRIQNYANPWGAFDRAMLEEMATVTDVWQPGMEVIEFWGQEAIDIMRKGNKRISMYTPVGGVRSVHPLGFFRSQGWLALHWGIEGGGWFAYQINDLFVSKDGANPGYGGVHVDINDVVTSRRWEAQRDGIEDFDIVRDLRDLAQAKGDVETLQVIQDSIDYVAGEVLTGATREAADYDFSYQEFMQHRLKLREAYEKILD